MRTPIRKGFCPHHRNRKVEDGYKYCFACRQRYSEYRTRFKHDKKYLIQTRLRRRRMIAKREAAGLCTRCGKNEADPKYCKPCLKVTADRNYRLRGKFTARREETTKAVRQFTLAQLQYEMGDNWGEAKEWCTKHLDVFIDPVDRAIYLSRGFNPGEDFPCEYLS